jgi:hypothetical protein
MRKIKHPFLLVFLLTEIITLSVLMLPNECEIFQHYSVIPKKLVVPQQEVNHVSDAYDLQLNESERNSLTDTAIYSTHGTYEGQIVTETESQRFYCGVYAGQSKLTLVTFEYVDVDAGYFIIISFENGSEATLNQSCFLLCDFNAEWRKATLPLIRTSLWELYESMGAAPLTIRNVHLAAQPYSYEQHYWEIVLFDCILITAFSLPLALLVATVSMMLLHIIEAKKQEKEEKT